MYFGGKSSLYSENGPREQEGGYSESQVEEGKGQIKGGVFGFWDNSQDLKKFFTCSLEAMSLSYSGYVPRKKDLGGRDLRAYLVNLVGQEVK